MKATNIQSSLVALFATVLASLTGFCAPSVLPPSAANEDFTPVAQAVVRLLESGDTAAFAKALAPSLEDWQAVRSTNVVVSGDDPLGPAFQRSLDQQRRALDSGAKQLLAKAAELKADFSKLRLKANPVPPKSLGRARYSSLQAENEFLPLAIKLEILLLAEPRPQAKDTDRLRGEYKVALANLLKFPGGWRCSRGGVQWVSFPAAVADEKTQREMAILAKVSDRKGISQADDPTLLQLGETLARFLRSRDTRILESEAMPSLEAVRSKMEKHAVMSGLTLPPREQLEQQWNSQRDQVVGSARSVVEQMEKSGIDLKQAEIQVKEVSLKSLYLPTGSGNADGLLGQRLQVSFAVKAGGTSKTGKEVSGEYVLTGKSTERLNGRWLLGGEILWQKLPAGVLEEKAAAELDFENYVVEHGALPPDTPAPDIEFVRLDNEQKGRLADLRGKIVILDFWATWCGPCQEPMAKMQKYREEHPDWKDRVELVALSIDDTLKPVRTHLEKRGWTNTFNVWAGPGGWQAAPAKAFRVSGVPTCYVLNAEGKVVQAGHPMSLHAPDIVNRLLK